MAALLVVGLGSCFVVGADRPPTPRPVPDDARAGLGGHSSPVSRVPGFGQIGFRVVAARSRGGSAPGPLRCALLADSGPERERGLMGRTDLAGYDAMVFRFDADSSAPFYNKDVPMPLTVAWFDAAGVLVGTAELAVCPNACPTVAPPVPYRLALEVRRGGLHRLGVGQGSALYVGGGCGT